MPLPTLQQFQAPMYQPATMKLQAMKMGDDIRRTDIAEGTLQLHKEDLDFKKMQANLATGLRFIPTLEQGEYPKFKEWIGSVNPDIVKFMPSNEDVAKKSPEEWGALRDKFIYDADSLTRMSIEQYKAVLKDKKRTPVGLEKKTNRTVVKDDEGNLTYKDTGETYKGGQLQPLTEPGIIASMGVAGDSFDSMAEAEKEQWYKMYSLDKTAKPDFFYRDPRSKQQFMKGFAQWQLKQGKAGEETIVERETIKAYAQSMKNQQKQRGLMLSFVGNLDKQLSRIGQIGEELQRFDPRLMNVPMVKWRTEVAGSGKEKAFQSYLLEISNEIAKLSTGSQASIRELSTEAQARWAKIHDPNLSLADLKIILDETQKMAHMRLESTNEAITQTLSEMEGVGSSQTPKTEPKQETKPQAPQPAIDYLKSHPEAKDQFKAKYGYLPEGF